MLKKILTRFQLLKYLKTNSKITNKQIKKIHYSCTSKCKLPVKNISIKKYTTPTPTSTSNIVFDDDDDGYTNRSNDKSINQDNTIKSTTQMEFEMIFSELVEKYGEINMIFPKNITWLSGAPGAGKGVMTPHIMHLMDIETPPIRLSSLLIGPEIEAIKAQGRLVSDKLVLKILLEKLLLPIYSKGVIIDGFPRTKMQAECIGLLFDKMIQLRRKFINQSTKFRRPVFHITVLYVDEDVSIERQLQRGKQIKEHNRIVSTTGVGNLANIRDTDIILEKARDRYQYFKENVYQSLQIIKNKFPFHFINAEGDIEQVKQRIKNELQYQSDAELGDDTFELIKQFPLAAEIAVNGRHELVTRLDQYARDQKELLKQVVELLKTDFLHIIQQQALTGKVKIRSRSDLLRNHPETLPMILDILTERGYKVVLDVDIQWRPSIVDLKNGRVTWVEKKVFMFEIGFPAPEIRHASQSWKWETTIN